jgi:Reverse transcriptase (RNA-dependent DNA polymerase).
MAIFVVIQSVFDSLWWPALIVEFKKRYCPRNLYLLIKDYLTKSVVIMEEGYHIVERQANRGCSQGSVLGLKKWTAY